MGTIILVAFTVHHTPITSCKSTLHIIKMGKLLPLKCSTQLFNVVLEKVMGHIQINKGGSIYTRTLQILAYADDINLIGRSTGQLKDAAVQMEGAANEVGLRIN